jgi:hypothetical protein
VSRHALLACLLLAVSPTRASEAQGPAPGPPALEDQFGKPDSLAAHHGRPVVVLVVNAERVVELKGWEADLRRRFSDLDFIRVVEIPQKPGVRPEGVVRKLRGRLPSDVPTLIDMDSVWSSAYGLEARQVNILLFDREGRQVVRFEGRRERALVERVAAELEARLGLSRTAGPAAP